MITKIKQWYFSKFIEPKQMEVLRRIAMEFAGSDWKIVSGQLIIDVHHNPIPDNVSVYATSQYMIIKLITDNHSQVVVNGVTNPIGSYRFDFTYVTGKYPKLNINAIHLSPQTVIQPKATWDWREFS